MNVRSLFRVAQSAATPIELTMLCAAVGELPASYLAVLAEARSVEWCINDRDGDCLALWAPGEIPELNDAYHVAKWVPELLVIGSDGGGNAIGFDRSTSTDPELWPVVRVGFGNLDRHDFVKIADDFRHWLSNGFHLYPNPS